MSVPLCAQLNGAKCSVVCITSALMMKLLVATEEGIRKLWQGVVPAIYRHVGEQNCQGKFELCVLSVIS